MNAIRMGALCALLGTGLATTVACSSDDTSAPAPAETSVSSTGATVLLDEFEVADGVTVRVEQAEQDAIVLSIEGKSGTEPTVDALSGRVSSILDVYAEFAPERAMPDALKQVLSKHGEAGEAKLEVPAGGLRDLANSGEVDADARVQKEAPRNVASFRSTYCNKDLVLEEHVTDGWYRKNNVCLTERTTGFTHSLYDVRQGFVAVYMYRGSADLKWSWQNTGAASWTAGGTYPVAEGTYRSFWVYHPGYRNLKFELVNAAGDGFNYAIHTANANFWEKGVDGSDLYHGICQCGDAAGNWYNFSLEYCSENKPEKAVSVGRSHCAAWTNKLESPGYRVSCGLVNFEKVSTGHWPPCNPRLPQSFNECTGAVPHLAGKCTYDCEATCGPQ